MMAYAIESADMNADRDCKDFDCPNWDTTTSGDTPLDCLTSLVSMINSEEIDDVNRWYRVVDTEKGVVL